MIPPVVAITTISAQSVAVGWYLQVADVLVKKDNVFDLGSVVHANDPVGALLLIVGPRGTVKLAVDDDVFALPAVSWHLT